MFKHWWYYVKDSYHTVKVLTDHNNLKSFMNVWKLNERQVKWVMRLLICNFEIAHKSEKTNSINVSSRWFDYKNENISANCLLFTLQQKLTRIENLNSFIFVAIRELYCIQVINDVEKTFIHSISMNRYSAEHVKSKLQDEIYCTWVINEVKKMFVHNVSENMSTYSAMHIKSILLRIMTLAVQEMHLNEVHFLKDRISQLELTTSRSTDVEMSIHRDCNVAEKPLNSVTETVDCKQLISRAIIRVLTIHETTYNFSSKFIVKLIKILQQEDEFAVRLRVDETTSIWKNDVKAWTLNS